MEFRTALEPLFSYFTGPQLRSSYFTCRTWMLAIDRSPELKKRFEGKVQVTVKYFDSEGLKQPSKEFTTIICIYQDWPATLKTTNNLPSGVLNFSVHAPGAPHGRLFCVNKQVKGVEIIPESEIRVVKSMIFDRCAIDRNSFDEYDIESQASSACDGYLLIQGVCGHVYHQMCIDRWTKSRSMCPLCSQPWENASYELSGPFDLDAFFVRKRIIDLFKHKPLQTHAGIMEHFQGEVKATLIKKIINSLIESDWIERGDTPTDYRLLN